MNKARVTSEHKGLYRVKIDSTELSAKVTGKRMFDASSREDYPAVGDWVTITRLDNEQAVIDSILPRKTILKRRKGKDNVQIIATNIDAALIVQSVNRDYSLNRFERYFAIAKNGNITPAIILNKADLISEEELNTIVSEIKERFPSIDYIITSVVNDKGLDELKNYIKEDKTYCFLGSSGVGKSSLINKLLGKEIVETNEISSWSERGKHTTTSREMYFLDNGGIVIDNPGIRGVGMAEDDTGIEDSFDEIAELARQCKFDNCTHAHEPGCAVIKALRKGDLDESKYNNYINLKKESDYYEMSNFEKREKNRQFGKFVKKVKKELKKYNE